MLQNDMTSVKNRAASILDAIDSLLKGSEIAISTNAKGDTSQKQNVKTGLTQNEPDNIAESDLQNMKNELANMKKTLTFLTGEVSSSQQAIKSLTGLGKQVTSLQATVNKLLSLSVEAQNPCDTPEGLAGEISGCP